MKKIIQSLAIFWLIVGVSPLFAQTTFPQNGVFDVRDAGFAFTNATIFKKYNEKLEKATLIVRNGKVEAIGVGIPIPKDVVVVDCNGKSIYPAFIEPFGALGMPEMRNDAPQGRQAPQMLSNKKGAFSWNEALKSEFRAHENFVANENEASILRGGGFGAVLTHRPDGMSRGSAALVSTGNDREHLLILKPIAAHVLSFTKGSSTQAYPSSMMGAMALFRQTYLDGQWYAKEGSKEEKNFSLEAWNSLQYLPQIFEVGDKLETLRAAKIASEFGKKYIYKGRGDEYQRLDALKATGAAFILPVNFPEAYDVEDPFDAEQVSLTDLKHWELATSNPARLAAANIDFCITTSGLKNKPDFLKQVQKAIEAGLSEENALKALTATPAKLLEVEADLGSLDKGKNAFFFIADKNIFDKNAKILHTWVGTKGYAFGDLNKIELTGTYSFDYTGRGFAKMEVKNGEMSIFINDTAKVRAEYKIERNLINITLTPDANGGVVRLTGVYEGGAMRGRGQTPDGTWVDWSAAPMAFSDNNGKNTPPSVSPQNKPKKAVGEVIYPFTAFGWTTAPKAERTVFKNATVWTNEADGILKEADVLIEAGKILQIGKNLNISNAKVVDATGKHLTAGIIDEHSHIAMSKGSNEGTQASSAEVRVADALNSEDVNIYRQLAGGVTASHILHGSANPIGGQTQLIKMRWGYEPEKLKFEGWTPFIKFALGENVKQSNSTNSTNRFPQSRMGVEQVYMDHFTRAQEYAAIRKSGKPYRRDLELDCIADILEEKCLITCHSYVQSEITMLLRVAEKFDFKINTFTHILEGYKVADKMAKHGVAAAGFADWWDYKYEVYEAIPGNAEMMHKQGVLTAINSDDAEMARRLNQEAAKTAMYTDFKDDESLWKFVTLNPAKMMHIDNKVGSIKVGKDADLVLWSHPPLSIYAKAEQTYVDGIKFFDRNTDITLRDTVRIERARLIQKSLEAKKGGAATQAVPMRTPRMYDCEDIGDELKEEAESHKD